MYVTLPPSYEPPPIRYIRFWKGYGNDHRICGIPFSLQAIKRTLADFSHVTMCHEELTGTLDIHLLVRKRRA